MCLLWISEKIFFISVYNINLMVLVPEKGSVYCMVKLNVKRYRYRPGVAQRVPGS